MFYKMDKFYFRKKILEDKIKPEMDLDDCFLVAQDYNEKGNKNYLKYINDIDENEMNFYS